MGRFMKIIKIWNIKGMMDGGYARCRGIKCGALKLYALSHSMSKIIKGPRRKQAYTEPSYYFIRTALVVRGIT